MQNKIDKIVTVLEIETNSKVNTYKENDKVCGFEIEASTNSGISMIIFLDLRGKENFTIEDVKKSFADYVNNFDVDDEIDTHRQDKLFKSHFTIKQALVEFEAFESWLLEVENNLSYFKDSGSNVPVKQYRIPIVYQSIRYMDVEADNLHNACKQALKDFFEIPGDYYLTDSFEIDEIVEENYPNETIDYNTLMEDI